MAVIVRQGNLAAVVDADGVGGERGEEDVLAADVVLVRGGDEEARGVGGRGGQQGTGDGGGGRGFFLALAAEFERGDERTAVQQGRGVADDDFESGHGNNPPRCGERQSCDGDFRENSGVIRTVAEPDRVATRAKGGHCCCCASGTLRTDLHHDALSAPLKRP